MKRNVIIFFIVILFLWNCSSKEVQKEHEPQIEKEAVEEAYEPTIFIDVNKVYCWVDLMPKIDGENKFHITGEITVHESNDYELNNLTLEKIKIFQKNKLLYSIKPTIKENDLVNNNLRNLLFSTVKGLSLYPNFNIEEEVNVEFIFEEDANSFTFKVFGLSIDKVH